MKPLIVLLTTLVVALLSVSAALAHDDHDVLPAEGVTVRGDRLLISPEAARAIGVRHAKVTLADVQRAILANGTIELPPNRQALVTTLVPGRVESVLVKPGERVVAGQRLALVSSTELESLQLEVLQARRDLELAKRLVESQRAAATGIVGKLLLQSEAEAAQQAARLYVARQKLLAIGLSAAELDEVLASGKSLPALALVSPIDGQVAVADVRAGQIVQPTEYLYHIVNPTEVWLTGKVLEADSDQLHAGQLVNAVFPALPGKRFSTYLDHVHLSLNPDHTLSIKATLPNAEGQLRAGMFGRLSIVLDSQRAVVCPADALIRRGAQVSALVERSTGTYVLRPVVVSEVRGGQAVIEDGLFPGDQVVTIGSHALASLFDQQQPSPPQSIARQSDSGPTFLGQIELPTREKTFASSPLEGRIRRVLIHHGDHVERGDVLAELDSLAFRNLQLDYLQALTRLRLAETTLERLAPRGDAVARKELWQLQAERDNWSQAARSLERQLELIGVTAEQRANLSKVDLSSDSPALLETLAIRAPAAGTVSDFELVPGQVVAGQQSLVELHEPETVWVRAYVFERDAAQLDLQSAMQITLVSDPDFQAVAPIERVDPLLDSEHRVLSVWAELPNPGLRLREGMTVTVRFSSPLAER